VRALITGAGGFVGQWLARVLLDEGHTVTGGTPDDPALATILSSDEREQIEWVRGDVRRIDDLRRWLDVATPDVIFHLAGVSSVQVAGADPGSAAEVNVVGAARLLGEVRVRRRTGVLDPLVLVVGSGEQYGRHEKADLPLAEDAEQRPLNAYAATKLAQEILALEAHRSEGVRVVCVRSFNHSGPGQPAGFLLPSLVARALALRGVQKAPRLVLGNGATVRDFLHVSDVVDAYILLATRGRPGEVYNVASGTGISVKDLAVRVLQATGVKAALGTDPALVRAVDVPALVGDPRKLREATGWTPQLTVQDVIEDLIAHPAHAPTL
jgi:GDP-4-dehydro-6-deoxy-D-mannose reductase